MSTDLPKRTESTELTVVRPRESLPPVSSVPGPTIEQLDDVERMRREVQDDIETLVGCPGCADCAVCRGEHMISADRAAEYRRQKALLDAEDDADEMNQNPDPPPEAA